MLVLNHDEKTWDCPKKRFKKRKDNSYTHSLKGKVKGIVGTCSKKPQILFWDIPHILFYFILLFSQQNMGLCCNFDSCF